MAQDKPKSTTGRKVLIGALTTLAAGIITALTTDISDAAKEYIFPTKAYVTGEVIRDNKGVPGMYVVLDKIQKVQGKTLNR